MGATLDPPSVHCRVGTRESTRTIAGWSRFRPICNCATEEFFEGRQRVIRGGVRQLTRIYRGEPHVELAHVAHVPPQLGDPQQAVGIEGGAARQTPSSAAGDSGLSVVSTSNLIAARSKAKRSAASRAIPRPRFVGAQPREVERQVAQCVIVGRVLR